MIGYGLACLDHGCPSLYQPNPTNPNQPTDLLHNVTAIPIVILREYGLLDPSLPSTTLPRVSYLGRDGKAWYPIPTCDEDVRVRAGNARCRAIVGMQPPFDPNSWDTWATRRLGCQTGRLLSPQDGIWPFMALKAEGGIDSILGMPPVYTNAFSEYMYVWMCECIRMWSCRADFDVRLSVRAYPNQPTYLHQPPHAPKQVLVRLPALPQHDRRHRRRLPPHPRAAPAGGLWRLRRPGPGGGFGRVRHSLPVLYVRT